MSPGRAGRPMRTALLIALAPSLIAGGSGVAQEKRSSPLDVWLDAGEAHNLGHADETARAIGDWPKHQLVWILNHVDQAPAPNRALRRGAVLHLDIALHVRARASGRLFPSYPKTGPPPPPLPALVVDGTGAGSGASLTHLELARALVQKIKPAAERTAFARLWYVASAAELARRKNFAELEIHLQHAREIVPDDPEILLAWGCLHESFAGSTAQAAARQRSSIAVGSRRGHHRRAERDFRDALARDPDLVEARLRLGRVLGLQQKHEDALVELQRILDVANDSTQTYYALMFLGRSEEALGRLEAARGHFERASALYPTAQSPRVALSRLAVEGGNEQEAQRVLEGRMAIERAPVEGDPWWVYDLGPGRYAERKLAELHLALHAETK